MIQVYFWRNSAASPAPNGYRKCPVADTATQRICFLLPEGSGFSENWCFHYGFDTDTSSEIWLGDLAAFCSPYASPTWLEMEWRGGFRERLLSSKEAALSVSGWMNSGSVWRHWGILDAQSSESQKVFGRQQGERAVLVYSWYCFRSFSCAELAITYDSPGVLEILEFSPNVVKVYSRVSYPPESAQQGLLQTSAVLPCLKWP